MSTTEPLAVDEANINNTSISTSAPSPSKNHGHWQERFQSLLQDYPHLDHSEKECTDVVLKDGGGFGDIYEAFLWINGRKVKVALKQMRSYMLRDESFVRVSGIPKWCNGYMPSTSLRFPYAVHCQRNGNLVAAKASECRGIHGLPYGRIQRPDANIKMDGERNRLSICDEQSSDRRLSFGEENKVGLASSCDIERKLKVLGIAQGLDYLHYSGVVHSDIKSVSA